MILPTAAGVVLDGGVLHFGYYSGVVLPYVVFCGRAYGTCTMALCAGTDSPTFDITVAVTTSPMYMPVGLFNNLYSPGVYSICFSNLISLCFAFFPIPSCILLHQVGQLNFRLVRARISFWTGTFVRFVPHHFLWFGHFFLVVLLFRISHMRADNGI